MKSYRRKVISIITVMAALSFSSMIFVAPAVAAPQTYTVNSTADTEDAFIGDEICETATTGECTLRAAIQESNATPDDDTIGFNIPGTGVKTIQVSTDLPVIGDSVTIDGYTQPGASANTAVSPAPLNGTILIEVKFNDHGGFSTGDTGIVIKGLSIFDCSASCLGLYSPSVVVQGNYVGLRADGLTVFENGESEASVNIGSSNDGSLVGGTNPADRNIMTNNSAGQTAISATATATFYGNYINIGKDGVTDLGSKLGISLSQGSGSILGGPSTGQANLISGSDTANVVMQDGTNHKVQGNLIGVDHTGNINDSLTNGVGFSVQMGLTNSLIGGTGPGEGNIIHGASGSAVLIQEMYIPAFQMSMTPSNISVLGNTISEIGVFDYPGFGDSNSGIELIKTELDLDLGIATGFEFQGPNANDVGDGDAGANGHINYPVLKSAQQVDSDLTVTFDVDAAGSPDDEYRIEFFGNDTSTIFGYGPGETYLGSTTVATGNGQTATIDVGQLDVAGKILSATLTAIDTSTTLGFGATSEFAQNIQIGSANDFDADGIADITEDAAANDGDGNDDGTADKLQATVSSYTADNIPVTFVTEGCSSNGSVSLLNYSSIDASDTGFSYPYGLTDFTLNCSRGDTVTVTKYVFDQTADDIADYHVRKYRPQTDTFEEVEDSTVERETVGDEEALVMSYSLTDGGALDDDGIANGVIVDPVGLAHVATSSQNSNNDGTASGDDVNSTSGTLAATGPQYVYRQVQYGLLILAVGLILLAGEKAPHLIRRKISK